jgi:hypothetical protein
MTVDYPPSLHPQSAAKDVLLPANDNVLAEISSNTARSLLRKQNPSTTPSSVSEQPIEHAHDESDLTDEQLARKLQAEWDQLYHISTPKPATVSSAKSGIDLPDTIAQPANTLSHHKRLTHVLSIVRWSCTDRSDSRRENAHRSAAGRITYYINEIHRKCGTCTPETSIHIINGLSSNADLSVSFDTTVRDIKRVLHNARTDPATGIVASIIASTDGITTNIPAFITFFEPYEELHFRFIIRAESSYQEYPLTEILTLMRSKISGEVHTMLSANEFVNRLFKVGLNKIQYVFRGRGVSF